MYFYNDTETTNSSQYHNITHTHTHTHTTRLFCLQVFPCHPAYPIPIAFFPFLSLSMPHKPFFVTAEDLCRLHHRSWMHFTLCVCVFPLFEAIGLWTDCGKANGWTNYRIKQTYVRTCVSVCVCTRYVHQRPLNQPPTADALSCSVEF